MDQSIKEELKERKETLNNLYEEFNKLKEEKDWNGAWTKLIETLNYANDTLKRSSEIIKTTLESKCNSEEIENTMECKNQDIVVNEQQEFTKKMIVIPKKQNIH